MKYLTLSFFTGFAIMTVELIATRIIAPYIGMSIYTWTSVIGIVLLGIAAGNYLGGIYADKHPHEKNLGMLIFIAALCIALIPELLRVIPRIAELPMPLMLKNVSIAALLFFPSSLILGTIYPFLARLSILTLVKLGSQAGLLSAFATIGSIVGTFATGFIFIGYIGSSKTLYGIALFLCIVSFFWKPFSRTQVFLIISAGLLAALTTSSLSPSIIYSGESSYYSIKVVDGSFNAIPSHMLFLDFDSHSISPLTRGVYAGTYQEITPLFGALAAHPIQTALVIGGGSYNIPKDLVRTYHAVVTVAEIDPAVTEIATKFFNLRDFPITSVTTDGRVFVRQTKEAYDLIFNDAFNSFISSPPHVATIESFREGKLRLTDTGIYATSIISALEGANSAWFQSVNKTFAAEFPNRTILYFHPNKKSVQNIILIGTRDNRAFDPIALTTAIYNLRIASESRLVVHFQMNPPLAPAGILLTDDFSPVERLTAPLVAAYIKKYSEWFYKQILLSSSR